MRRRGEVNLQAEVGAMGDREKERQDQDGDKGLAAEPAVMERSTRRARKQTLEMERLVGRKCPSRLRWIES